jgi:hypothetical protein
LTSTRPGACRKRACRNDVDGVIHPDGAVKRRVVKAARGGTRVEGSLERRAELVVEEVERQEGAINHLRV